jgi:hypothetical protein
MGRLNKKQKEILVHLNKADKGFMSDVALLDILKDEPDNILPDIELLLREELVVTTESLLGGTFPTKLAITPIGKAKLKESIGTRLLDSAHDNPWAVVAVIVAVTAIIVTICLTSISLYLYSENINLQQQIKQESDLREIMPPTVYLIHELKNGSNGELEIIPTLYFKKNSDRLFTIISYKPNLTLNGIRIGQIGGGYPGKLGYEGITEGTEIFSSFYPTINYYDFFHHRNVLTVDYVIKIKDMDNQITYIGNVTTEINTSSTFRNELMIFTWSEVSNT